MKLPNWNASACSSKYTTGGRVLPWSYFLHYCDCISFAFNCTPVKVIIGFLWSSVAMNKSTQNHPEMTVTVIQGVIPTVPTATTWCARLWNYGQNWDEWKRQKGRRRKISRLLQRCIRSIEMDSQNVILRGALLFILWQIGLQAWHRLIFSLR